MHIRDRRFLRCFRDGRGARRPGVWRRGSRHGGEYGVQWTHAARMSGIPC